MSLPNRGCAADAMRPGGCVLMKFCSDVALVLLCSGMIQLQSMLVLMQARFDAAALRRQPVPNRYCSDAAAPLHSSMRLKILSGQSAPPRLQGA